MKVDMFEQKNDTMSAILNSTGFVGRNSLDVEVTELSLPECVSCWGSAGERLSALEKLDFLAVTGGVPRYVEEVQRRAPLRLF